MHHNLFVLIFLLVSFVLHAQNDQAKLVSALLAETSIEEDLQELCDEIGGRVTGSPSNQLAVAWAYQKFLKAGVAVRKHQFEMPKLWNEKSCELRVEGDLNFNVQAVSKYMSPPGQHKGQVVFMGKGQMEDFFMRNGAAVCEGKFILVETDLCFDINGLFAEYEMAKRTEDLARKYGAKAILFMASRPRKLLYRFITSEVIDNEMVQLVVAREDAKRMIRSLEKGKSLSIDIQIDADIGNSFTTENVIAEITGSQYPDEIIVIGAHLDSWALGTGANDNGCNVSMLIDIARQMQRLGIQPKRSIRFALWNGEEQGYFGSWAYTRDHQKELDNHLVGISIDIGSGPITGYFLNGRKEMDGFFKPFFSSIQGLGSFENLPNIIIGTDNLDFMLEGVPNLVAIHKPDLYGPNYHAASDTYDKVNLKSLKLNSAIVGATILALANADPEVVNWKRQSRKEIHQMLLDQKMEFVMRMFNLWESWVASERGRSSD